MHMKRVIAILFLLPILVSSCKKYPEGPAFSLRSKKNRVVGDWNVTWYGINGSDARNTSQSGNVLTNCFFTVGYTNTTTVTKYYISFKDNWQATWSQEVQSKTLNMPATLTACSAVYTESTDVYGDSGSWEFVSGKEKIQLNWSGSGTTEVWDIIRLKNTEMKLKRVDSNNNVYELTLEQ